MQQRETCTGKVLTLKIPGKASSADEEVRESVRMRQRIEAQKLQWEEEDKMAAKAEVLVEAAEVGADSIKGTGDDAPPRKLAEQNEDLGGRSEPELCHKVGESVEEEQPDTQA